MRRAQRTTNPFCERARRFVRGKQNEKTIRMSEHLTFFQQFLRNPRQIGSVIPSSRFLERRIIRAADIARADVVVELGPGNGGTTRALLRAMSPQARLLAIEINRDCYEMVCRIRDPRLTVHLGSAENLSELLQHYGLAAADVVVSGIPFSTMDEGTAARIAAAIAGALKPGGRFVAYQVSRKVADVNRGFPGPARVEVELLNIPPLRVFRWEKQAGGAELARRAASSL